jgi:DNA-binding IclR family transcriptional regulator
MAVIPSPAVGRLAAILATLGDEPAGLSLAEVTRRTGLRKATAHSLLLGLVEVGYVGRAGVPARYTLGAGLVALGARARAAQRTPEAVLAAVAPLAEAAGGAAMVGAVRGPDIAILAVREAPHPFGVAPREGARLPWRAPVGPVYAAEAPEPVVAGWLDRAMPALPPADRARLLRQLDLVRRRGWSATVRPAAVRPTTATRPPALRELAEDDTGDVMVVGLSVPVHDPDDPSPHAAALVDLPTPLPPARVAELGAALAAAVTDATGGPGAHAVG